MTHDIISAKLAGTIDGLFIERVKRSANALAYGWHDGDTNQWLDMSWQEMGKLVARWQKALAGESLESGDRVALILRNCPEWAAFDLAALGLGMADVPLYTDDRPDNIAYILQDAGVKVLLVQDEGRWKNLQPAITDNDTLKRILILNHKGEKTLEDPRIRYVDDWLPEKGDELTDRKGDPHAMASIVYTSGTTGRPKGVMLSHNNMLSVSEEGLHAIKIVSEDRFLSFLPLSHTLERTGGYYLPIMSGSSVTYARSVAQLGQDFIEVRPTIMISVPRVFERVYGKVKVKMDKGSPMARKLFELAVDVGWHKFEMDQGRASWAPKLLLHPLLDKLVGSKIRARMGGKLRIAVSGGAPLSAQIAKIFIGLGIPVLQGYGLTETSPVICVNTPDHNQPASVGRTLNRIEVKIGERDELLVKTPGMMLGYWNNEKATKEIIDEDGWLHTGDQVRIDDGYVFITGRIKDIMVLSNGEKIPPSDMELAIALDPLIEQVMIVGEGHPYLTAMIVLNPELWPDFVKELGMDPEADDIVNNNKLISIFIKRIKDSLKDFPGFAKVRKITLLVNVWSVEDGLITPTMKIKRAKVLAHHADQIAAMYDQGPA